MNDFKMFYEYVDNILNVDVFGEENYKYKSYVVLYKKYLNIIISKFDEVDEISKNRIINDHIFTELIFERIKCAIENNDLEKVLFLFKKDLSRIKFLSDYGIKYPLLDVVTQNKAIDILIKYLKDWEKEHGIVDRKYKKIDDLNLTDDEMNKIMCLCVNPEEISLKKLSGYSNK